METFTRHPDEPNDKSDYVEGNKRQTVIFMPDVLESDKHSDIDIEAKGVL